MLEHTNTLIPTQMEIGKAYVENSASSRLSIKMEESTPTKGAVFNAKEFLKNVSYDSWHMGWDQKRKFV